MILFVYTIGIHVGPGFFAAMRSTGLRLNALAASVVLLGVIVAITVGGFAQLPIPVMLGILSGAVTNTPSLAATQQVLGKLGFTTDEQALPALGYAVAYPFRVLGILLTMWLVRFVLKIQIAAEGSAEGSEFEADRERNSPALKALNVRVTNTNLAGLALPDVPGMVATTVVCSRLKRDGVLIVPKHDAALRVDDLVHWQPGAAVLVHAPERESGVARNRYRALLVRRRPQSRQARSRSHE